MPTLADLAAGIVILGLVMYACFGGADFGGGIWTALASGPRKIEQREACFHAIGPVWETNHVWLIFVVVVLFNLFPKAFAVLFIALLIPLVIALVGINFRGAAFAFRHFGRQTGRGVPFIARTFEVSSILTPFFLGMAVTAAASGRIVTEGDRVVSGLWAWVSPFSATGGLVGLAICAYLAPIYLAVRTAGDLRDDFRLRGMIAGLVLGFLTAAAVPVAIRDAPEFARRLLSTRALVPVGLAVLFGIATEAALWKRKWVVAQLCAAGTVALTIAGFGAAMYPDLVISRLTIAAAAAPRESLVVFFSVLPVGLVILVPSLVLLYWTFRGEPDPDLPVEK